MNNITFSVIVVCLNAGEKLLKTVDSVMKQSYGKFEIIVKDGMSTDGYVERLPEDERLRIIRQKDKGIYDAMNQAITLAEGDYVLFLNCGDYLYDEKVLENVAAFIGGDAASAGIYYGDIYNRNVSAKIASNPHINAFACYRNVPCHQTCFYERELMKRRGYNIKYKVRADYEHFLGCFFAEQVQPVYMQIVVASYEGGGFSETKENIARSAAEHKAVVKKYMSKSQIIKYEFLMALTLAPLRTWIAQNEKLSGVYNKIKEMIYGRRR